MMERPPGPARCRAVARGGEAVRRTVRAAMELGIEFLTIYSFSSENWSRPADEIDDLMGLIKRFIRRDLAELDRNGVAIRVIGERGNLEPEMLAMIEEAERLTARNTALNLVVAFNYGARAEITKAARVLADRVAAGELRPEAITEELFAGGLETSGIPDPDLLIRTSGELRLSNFLLWQAVYRVRVPRQLLARVRARAAATGDRPVPLARSPLWRALEALDGVRQRSHAS
jgi:undecaprenyl diphosphate synthase